MNACGANSPLFLDSAEEVREPRRIPVERAAGTTRLPSDVEAAYTKYLRDHHGDLSDTEGLAATLYNAGARNAIQAMVSMSDLLPLVAGLERRVQKIRQVLEDLDPLASSREATA